MKQKKIFIALPIYRQTEPETEKTLNGIVVCASHIYEVSELYRMRGSPNIYMQRHTLAKEFLKTDADYYLYFDADQTPDKPQEDIEMLIEDNMDIVSPLISRKQFPHIPTCISKERGYFLEEGKDLDTIEDFRKYPPVFEAKYSCGGVCLIKRKVIEAVENPFYPQLNETGGLLSVDFSFYKQAREKGFSCWVDQRIGCRHIGVYGFSPADYYGLVDSGKLQIEKIGGLEYQYTIKPDDSSDSK